jgi:hypothetical protein
VRVVDASVIPLTTGVAIQSTVYAIAEKVGLGPHLYRSTRSDRAESSGRGCAQKRVGSRVGRVRPTLQLRHRTSTRDHDNEEELLYVCLS